MSESVLITGASRGIGAETARLFARQGYAVGINYHRSQAQAQALLEQIQREGGQGALYPADVSSREAVEAMVQYGPISAPRTCWCVTPGLPGRSCSRRPPPRAGAA